MTLEEELRSVCQERLQLAAKNLELALMVRKIKGERHDWPLGTEVTIDHDGFTGEIIGYYHRSDGYCGVVLQQVGTKVVHVYGLKHLRKV